MHVSAHTVNRWGYVRDFRWEIIPGNHPAGRSHKVPVGGRLEARIQAGDVRTEAEVGANGCRWP